MYEEVDPRAAYELSQSGYAYIDGKRARCPKIALILGGYPCDMASKWLALVSSCIM